MTFMLINILFKLLLLIGGCGIVFIGLLAALFSEDKNELIPSVITVVVGVLTVLGAGFFI